MGGVGGNDDTADVAAFCSDSPAAGVLLSWEAWRAFWRHTLASNICRVRLGRHVKNAFADMQSSNC
jgi:hypothetical protein